MDIKDILNKIRWQLYMRSPNGGIYKKIKECLSNEEKDYLNSVFNGEYLYIGPLEMFIKGYYSKNSDDIYNFYSFLLCSPNVKVKYNSKENFDILEFKLGEKSVFIPKPYNNLNELASLRFELLDLILPYMISDIKKFKKLSFNEGPYEYIGDYVDVRLNKGDTVLDLGANFGVFSAFAASKGCNVYAFEPMRDTVLKYLNKLCIIYENIKVIESAISNEVGYSKLILDKKDYGGSFISKRNLNGELVITDTIDNFVSKNLDSVDFIKADIEGAECAMLEGARDTLKYYHPKLSLCKYHKLDDEKNIKKLILSANPNYVIESNWKKIYAEVKK